MTSQATTKAGPPSPKELSGEDLYRLIGELTRPRRSPSPEPPAPGEPGDPEPKPRTVASPSLWDLLIGNTARAGGQGSAVQRSRPPVSTQVLSLVHEVRSACEQRLRTAGRQPIVRSRTLSDATRQAIQARPDSTVVEMWRDIPAELLAINAITASRPVEQAGWAERVAGWVHRAESALGLVTERIQLPRGTRCMDCGEAWVLVIEDGEQVRRPAVHLVWHPTGALHFVACSACNSSRWPHDLHALAERQAELNATHDTLAITDAEEPADA